MGLSGSWLAAKGDLDPVIEGMSATKTGASNYAFNFAFSAQQLGDWTAVASADEDIFEPEFLKAFSSQFDCVLVRINEAVMCSDIHYFANGNLVWGVAHDGQDPDPDHLDRKGITPPELDQVLSELNDEEEDEFGSGWMMIVPELLAAKIVGEGYQQSLDNQSYEIAFVEKEAPKRTLLDRIFGRS